MWLVFKQMGASSTPRTFPRPFATSLPSVCAPAPPFQLAKCGPARASVEPVAVGARRWRAKGEPKGVVEA